MCRRIISSWMMNFKGFAWKRFWRPRGTILKLAWRDWERRPKTSVRIAGVPAELRVKHRPNTSVGDYHFTTLLGDMGAVHFLPPLVSWSPKSPQFSDSAMGQCYLCNLWMLRRDSQLWANSVYSENRSETKTYECNILIFLVTLTASHKVRPFMKLLLGLATKVPFVLITQKEVGRPFNLSCRLGYTHWLDDRQRGYT
jgi:hypothetical protein